MTNSNHNKPYSPKKIKPPQSLLVKQQSQTTPNKFLSNKI